MFAHGDPKARTAANLDFKKRCAEARVLPYFVPVGGFMLTPRYDDDPAELGAAVEQMAQCALDTTRQMGWAPSVLLPVLGPESAPTPTVERYQGPIDSAGAVGGDTSLEAAQLEVVALVVAYASRAAAEWTAHAAAARSAGVTAEAISAIARGATPAFDAGSKEAAIHAFVADLVEHKRVSADNYAAAHAALGESGVVDLVSAVGSFSAQALASNAFERGDARAPWEADR